MAVVQPDFGGRKTSCSYQPITWVCVGTAIIRTSPDHRSSGVIVPGGGDKEDILWAEVDVEGMHHVPGAGNFPPRRIRCMLFRNT